MVYKPIQAACKIGKGAPRVLFIAPSQRDEERRLQSYDFMDSDPTIFWLLSECRKPPVIL